MYRHESRSRIMALLPHTGRELSPRDSDHLSYDWRWLLFIIPLVLAFIAIIVLVWFVVQRRRKKRQRQSILRNVTLDVADEEKAQRRLSRGNSLSSRLSRMASAKGSHRHVPDQSKRQSTLSYEDDEKHTSHSDDRIAVLTKDGVSEAREDPPTFTIVAAPESQVPSENKDVARKGSGRSADGVRFEHTNSNAEIVQTQESPSSAVPSTVSYSTSNPFVTPTTSSNDHTKLSTPSQQEDVRQEQDASFSEQKPGNVVRLREPSPAALHSKASRPKFLRQLSSNATLQRSNTHKDSSQSFPQPSQAQVKRAASLASAKKNNPSDIGDWSYTSRAQQWRAPPNSQTQVSRSHSARLPSQDRRASLGVSGSKFVETFDE